MYLQAIWLERCAIARILEDNANIFMEGRYLLILIKCGERLCVEMAKTRTSTTIS
jgi:hypothetical protein